MTSGTLVRGMRPQLAREQQRGRYHGYPVVGSIEGAIEMHETVSSKETRSRAPPRANSTGAHRTDRAGRYEGEFRRSCPK